MQWTWQLKTRIQLSQSKSSFNPRSCFSQKPPRCFFGKLLKQNMVATAPSHSLTSDVTSRAYPSEPDNPKCHHDSGIDIFLCYGSASSPFKAKLGVTPSHLAGTNSNPLLSTVENSAPFYLPRISLHSVYWITLGRG